MKTKLLLTLLVAAVLSTSAGAVEITIVNPGFEDPALADGERTYYPTGWSEGWYNLGAPDPTIWLGYAWQAGAVNPDTDYGYAGVAPEGENVAYVTPEPGYDCGLSQVLSATLQANVTYELSVLVGNPGGYNGGLPTCDYRVELVAGNVAVATTNGNGLGEGDPSPAPDTWTTASLSFTPNAGHAQIGSELAIRLIGVDFTSDEVELNFDDIRLNSYADPMDPSPYDGEFVYGGEVDLNWTNMDPNEGVTDVYVDVWFGLDPNRPSKPDCWEKVVEAGENTTTVTVPAPIVEPGPTTYFWQVNSYIYGSPAGDLIKGRMYRFYSTNDKPLESVDAGDDMITWSGESVALDGTVVDDGVSALTYAWSANPDVGVVFSATDVEDPIVTISKPGEVAIVNAGFEDSVLSEGDWDYAHPGWGWVGAGEGNIGTWNPGPGAYGGVAPEGEYVVWVDGKYEGECGLAQILAETLAADTTYILFVEVGNSPYYKWGSYKVQLLAGGTGTAPDEITGGELLAEDDNSLTIEDETFETSIVVHTTGDVSDPHVGEPIQIRLIAKDDASEIDFDDVRLYTIPPRGISPDVYSVELTVAVNDELNTTPVEDTMTIDVYDDACAAARIGAGLAADNPGDLDEDCDTDIVDLAAGLETWLNDVGLMEAVVRPTGPGIVSSDSAGIGEALYERWDSGGSAESMLMESSTPDYTEILTSTEWGVGDDNALSNYRGRITAWLIPPVTGDYTFWIATDDNGRLWLSTDNDPANATLVASVPGWAAEDVWDKFPEQQSAPITLQGGKAYWLRGGYQEGGGGDHIQIAWAGSEAGIAEHTIIEGQYFVGIDPTGLVRPSPGSYVHPSDNLELSWTNMDPNNPGDPVYVDVWFGMEPNETNPAHQMDLVVDATTPEGEDANSVAVSAPIIEPEPTTYYWRVDSYIYGSATGDPIEGFMWRFHAVSDIPVSVEAGDDMITWSGEPVELEPSIDDDGVSDLTIAWSADPDTGVVFSAADIEAPTVTITKATGDAATFTLTLEVDDSVNPPVEDTMTIDVYDNPCLAAIIGLGQEYDPGDFDADCDTDIEDYAAMALTWLVDYELTEPVEKP